MEKSEQQYRDELKSDPGNPGFVDFAALLVKQERFLEAVDVCLAGLSSNPACHAGRLMLARVLYRMKYFPFAVRELVTLCADFPESEALRRLLEKLSAGTVVAQPAPGAESTVAEAEFDFEGIEALEEEKKKGPAN